MKESVIIICLGLLLMLAGCIPSVHPLYTDDDLIYDPSLIGQWADKDGKEAWTFKKSADKEYKLVYVDEKGKKGEFVVHLLKVGNRKFLDLYPADPDLNQNDFYKCHLLPVHTFIRVQQIEPTLQMAMLKPDWIKKILRKNPGAIHHETVDDSILLTAQPKEMQAFLIKHDNTPDAWNECSPLTRRLEKPELQPEIPTK